MELAVYEAPGLARREYAEELVSAFLAARSSATLRGYDADLDRFASFLGVATQGEAVSLLLGSGPGNANALVGDYRSSMIEGGYAPATINRRLSAIRALVKVARIRGLVSWPLEVPGVKSEPYRDTRGPGAEGVRAMLRVLEGRGDAKAVRDRAILHLLYDVALRREEVRRLDIADVDEGSSTLAVLGKGRTQKIRVTLPPATLAAVMEWLEVRDAEEGPLFVGLPRSGRRTRITGQAIYDLVKAYGEDAGLGKVRPHGLRHAAITEALELTGGDVRRVQRFSRHRDIRILNTYDDNRADLAGEVARLVAAG